MKMTITPADVAQLSIAQIALLPAAQKAELDKHLTEAQRWLTTTRNRFNAALELCYSARVKAALVNNEVAVFRDGKVRVRVAQNTEVHWDQDYLASIAARIQRAGERIEDYLDVSYHIPETRYQQWSESLQDQFADARRFTSNKATFELQLDDEYVH